MKDNAGQGKILIIDDDQGLLRLNELALRGHGFEVYTASDGKSGLEMFYRINPDLVILDVMMPDLDGLTLCRKIREHSQVPLLFLSARGHVQARVEGLRLGADDYIVKPFDVQELVARIEALLRRTRHTPAYSSQVLRFDNGRLVLNRETRQVFLDGERLHLTPTESKLLFYLAERAGRILSVETLYNAVWSYHSDADLNVVRWYIWRLRRKLKEGERGHFIITEPGIGYRFTTL